MDSKLNNYAVAFFNLAEENKKLDSYFSDALDIQNIFNENSDLLDILTSYLLDEKERISIIDNVFSFLRENESRDFLKVIMANHKLKYINQIIDLFHELYNNKMKIAKGIIYSAKELTVKQIKEIENAFLVKKNQKVLLSNRIDESLIGGLKIIINDHIYDNSIKNRLDLLKTTLKKEGDTL